MSVNILINQNRAYCTLHNLFGSESIDYEYKYRALVSGEQSISKLTENDYMSIEISYRGKIRVFEGFVAEVKWIPLLNNGMTGGGAPGLYEIILTPYFTCLKKCSHSRTFVKQSLLEILSIVSSSYSQLKINYQKLSRRYSSIDYVVQYQETDYDFMRRLLSQHGVAYYFLKNQMILYDDISGYIYHDKDPVEVTLWQQTARYVPEKICLIDDVKVSANLSKNKHDITHYQYLGYFKSPLEGERLLKYEYDRYRINQAEIKSQIDQIDLQLASVFFTDDYYVIKEIYYSVNYAFGAIQYSAQCYVTQAGNMLRMSRQAQPIAPESLKAVVVGVDQSPLLKLSFRYPWDENKTESPFVRVRQYWCGNGYGAQFMPGVGDEILLSYLDADFTRPIVMGVPAVFSNNIIVGNQNNYLSFSKKNIGINVAEDALFSVKQSFNIEAVKNISLVSQSDATSYINAGQLSSFSAGQRICFQVGGSHIELKNSCFSVAAEKVLFVTTD